MAGRELSIPRHRGAALLVVVVLLLALVVRESLPSGGLEARGGRDLAQVTDAPSAWHHRRVSLALSAPRLPQSDRFLGFPGTAANPELPVFDHLLAFTARFMPRTPAGPGGMPPDELRLEVFLRSVGPVLALLWLALLYRLLRRVGQGTVLASLGALAFAAVVPVVVEYGAAGRLHVEALAAILFTVQIGLLAPVWRQEQPLDRMFYAMLAGFVTGLGLATSPLFLVPHFAAWAALLLSAVEERGERRQNTARTALLFWITSALVGQFPVLGGPWLPAESGTIAGWAGVLRVVFFVGALPLALAVASPRREWSRRFAIGGISLAAAALFGGLAWLGPDSEAAALFHAALGRAAGAAPIELALLAGAGLAWVLAFLGALVGGRVAEPGGERVFLATAGVLTLVAALIEPTATLFFAIPASLGLVRLLSGPGRTRAVWAGLALAIGWSAIGLFSPAPDAEGEALIGAARWLRRNGEPTGPWNSATAIQRGGVLCDSRTAPLVAWYGRRATATVGIWRVGDPAGRTPLENVLAAGDSAELAERARELGLRYLVLGEHSAERLARTGADPALFEAIRGEPETGGELSRRWESDGGRAVIVEILSPR